MILQFKGRTLINTQQHLVLHPEDNKEVLYFTRKWRVSKRQIFDAILDTGSLKLSDIKERLRKKGRITYSS